MVFDNVTFRSSGPAAATDWLDLAQTLGEDYITWLYPNDFRDPEKVVNSYFSTFERPSLRFCKPRRWFSIVGSNLSIQRIIVELRDAKVKQAIKRHDIPVGWITLSNHVPYM
jgi:hypothetical protein